MAPKRQSAFERRPGGYRVAALELHGAQAIQSFGDELVIGYRRRDRAALLTELQRSIEVLTPAADRRLATQRFCLCREIGRLGRRPSSSRRKLTGRRIEPPPLLLLLALCERGFGGTDYRGPLDATARHHDSPRVGVTRQPRRQRSG